MSSSAEVSVLMGQKLLQGWRLLAESCIKKGCYVPLMENKKDGSIVCLGCNTIYKREYINAAESQMIAQEEEEVASNPATLATKPSIPPLTTSQPIPPEKQGLESSSISSISGRTVESILSPVSSSVVTTIIPLTPLIETPQNNPSSSSPDPLRTAKTPKPKKHRFLESDSDEEIDDGPEHSMWEKIKQQSQRTNAVSKKIGEKLLAGWTLLEESCPTCRTPLMRDHQKAMFCLNCDTVIISAKDFDPTKHTLSPKQKNNSQQLKVIDPFPPVVKGPELLQIESGSRRDKSNSKPKIDPKHAGSVALSVLLPNQTTNSSITGSSSSHNSSTNNSSTHKKNNINNSDNSPNHHQVVDSTVNTLYSKMDDLQKILIALQDYRQYKDILAAIAECAQAIAALQKIR